MGRTNQQDKLLTKLFTSLKIHQKRIIEESFGTLEEILTLRMLDKRLIIQIITWANQEEKLRQWNQPEFR